MIDCKIMSMLGRQYNVDQLKNILSLSDCDIVYDKGDNSPLSTAISAWGKPYMNGITHRVLLQDDVQVCNGFAKICDRISLSHPNEVVGLFPFDTLNIDFDLNDSPFYDLSILSGCAIMMPVKYIESFIEYAKEKPVENRDNWTLRAFCEDNGIRMIQTVPALVQHIGDVSLFCASSGIRRTKYFQENPIADWDTQKINTPKFYSESEKILCEAIRKTKERLSRLARERM